MRNVGLISFGVTLCVLVPAAVNRLIAGREQVTKLFAPSARTLELEDGAKIDVALDKALVDPGDTIHVKLAASAPTARHLTVGVLVLGSTGTEGSRVPSPPVGVAHETVRLDLDATGHATKELPIRLRGARTQFEPFAHYTILVMPPKAADKLERTRSNARIIPEPGGGIPSYNRSGEKFQTMYWAIQGEQAPEGDEELFAPGKIARLEAHTRPKSSSITIAAPDTAPRDGKFTVAVTVKNPGKRTLTGLEVSLDTLDGMMDDSPKGQYLGLGADAVEIEAGTTKLDLAGHETRRLEFQVTAKALGVVGLYARARCGGDCRDVDALYAGAVEATEITETPAVVGAR
jgi:hypothetical protein